MPRALCRCRLKSVIVGQRSLTSTSVRSTWCGMFQPIGSAKPTRVTGMPASVHAGSCDRTCCISFSVGTSPVQLEPKQLLTFRPPSSRAPCALAFSIIFGHACDLLGLRPVGIALSEHVAHVDAASSIRARWATAAA